MASVELHVSEEALPLITVVGFAVNVAVGAALTVTVTVATVLVPPEPVQVSEKAELVVSAPVL